MARGRSRLRATVAKALSRIMVAMVESAKTQMAGQNLSQTLMRGPDIRKETMVGRILSQRVSRKL
jgi:hypothetical protein